MSKEKIKTMLNVEVLNHISDSPTRNILKCILFDDNTKIDWNMVYTLIMEFMPELKLFDGYKEKTIE